MLFTTALWISGGFAGLCAAALPLWLLGIPGVDGAYARGWKKGLSTLFLYPIVWLICGAPYFFQRSRLDDIARARWQAGTTAAFTVVFLGALICLVLAFRTMRSENANANTPT